MRSLCLVALLAIAAPASAEDATTPPAVKKEKKVCRKEVDTGSIMPRSVCRTRSEWSQVDAAKDKQSQRDTEAMRNRSTSGRLGAD